MARILVVDDDAAVRFALYRLLEQQGYEVVTAADGREGLQCVTEHSPDVVLVDIFMPEQDGIETIRQMRRAFPHLPIIALSGGNRVYRADEVLAIARDFGARYAFRKPVAPDALLAAVQALLTAATGDDSVCEQRGTDAAARMHGSGVK